MLMWKETKKTFIHFCMYWLYWFGATACLWTKCTKNVTLIIMACCHLSLHLFQSGIRKNYYRKEHKYGGLRSKSFPLMVNPWCLVVTENTRMTTDTDCFSTRQAVAYIRRVVVFPVAWRNVVCYVTDHLNIKNCNTFIWITRYFFTHISPCALWTQGIGRYTIYDVPNHLNSNNNRCYLIDL